MSQSKDPARIKELKRQYKELRAMKAKTEAFWQELLDKVAEEGLFNESGSELDSTESELVYGPTHDELPTSDVLDPAADLQKLESYLKSREDRSSYHTQTCELATRYIRAYQDEREARKTAEMHQGMSWGCLEMIKELLAQKLDMTHRPPMMYPEAIIEFCQLMNEGTRNSLEQAQEKIKEQSRVLNRLAKAVIHAEYKKADADEFWNELMGELGPEGRKQVLDKLAESKPKAKTSKNPLGHKTRMSDSSICDEICILCGATDARDDDRLTKPCTSTHEQLETTCNELPIGHDNPMLRKQMESQSSEHEPDPDQSLWDYLDKIEPGPDSAELAKDRGEPPLDSETDRLWAELMGSLSHADKLSIAGPVYAAREIQHQRGRTERAEADAAKLRERVAELEQLVLGQSNLVDDCNKYYDNLRAALEQLIIAADSAGRDMAEWQKLAQQQRDNHPGPDDPTLIPSAYGIERSKRRSKVLTDAIAATQAAMGKTEAEKGEER